jgi:hypothetical protein
LEGLARLAPVNLTIKQGDVLIPNGDGGERQLPKAAGALGVACEVVDVQPLRNDPQDPALLVVKAAEQCASIPVIDAVTERIRQRIRMASAPFPVRVPPTEVANRKPPMSVTNSLAVSLETPTSGKTVRYHLLSTMRLKSRASVLVSASE